MIALIVVVLYVFQRGISPRAISHVRFFQMVPFNRHGSGAKSYRYLLVSLSILGIVTGIVKQNAKKKKKI